MKKLVNSEDFENLSQQLKNNIRNHGLMEIVVSSPISSNFDFMDCSNVFVVGEKKILISSCLLFCSEDEIQHIPNLLTGRKIPPLQLYISDIMIGLSNCFWENQRDPIFDVSMNRRGSLVNHNGELISLESSMFMEDKSLTVSDCGKFLLECNERGVYEKRQLNPIGNAYD